MENPTTMTSTNTESQYTAFEVDQIQAAKTLRNPALILGVVDENWSVIANIHDQVGLQKLEQQRIGLPPFRFEIVVNSIDMLREYIATLHPRIETLINYHTRPLSIIMKSNDAVPELAKNGNGQSVFRLVQDPFAKQLIDQIDAPIITCFAISEEFQNVPRHIGSISSDILEMISFILQPAANQKVSTELPVMVELTKREELEFIRE